MFPDDFKPVCPPKNLMQDDDPFVDDLFSEAPMHGATLLCALFPRYYVDLNRAITDIDPNLLGEPWPFEETYPLTPTFRSDAGIGLIWRRVKPGINIYDGPLRAQDIANRIETYYRPYHQAIDEEIDEFLAAGLPPLLLSLHSFTHIWRGIDRALHAGILWDRDDR